MSPSNTDPNPAFMTWNVIRCICSRKDVVCLMYITGCSILIHETCPYLSNTNLVGCCLPVGTLNPKPYCNPLAPNYEIQKSFLVMPAFRATQYVTLHIKIGGRKMKTCWSGSTK
jgi:hypothetical protein